MTRAIVPPGSMRWLTILISTHDRADLLARTLRHLDAACRPSGWTVDVLVVANACTDGTHAFLDARDRGRSEPDAAGAAPPLPLRWIAEPTVGKSHALNRAIPLLESEWAAFVDDDHRVDEGYLEAICAAADLHPDADLLCGRILPDWDGSEPAWVHDTGDYRIYPLPVPRYDLGGLPLASPQEHGIPGGGNLVLRTGLFAKVGPFATDYGPVGHNLAGGEDQEWVRRAIASGARLQYVPDIVQYHYVDPARLRLGYLVRKAYERSASTARLARRTVDHGLVPPYMVRKLARHLLSVASSFTSRKCRFHLVRAAASLGELKGHLQARSDRPRGG